MGLKPCLQMPLDRAIEVAHQEADALVEGKRVGAQAPAAAAISRSSGACSMPER